MTVVVMGSVFAVQLVERVRSWFDPAGVEALTEEVFRAVWRGVRTGSSTRHPFHREVLDDLGSLLDQVEALPPDTLSRSTASSPPGGTCRAFIRRSRVA